MDILSGPYRGCLYMIYCSLKFISSCLASACGAFSDRGGKGQLQNILSPSKCLSSQISVLSDASQSGGRKVETSA